MQTVLALGDLHCGHRVGLTPPSWQQRTAWMPQQKLMWDFFLGGLDKVGQVDTLIINGDAIDGNGYRSGGIEQTEIDWDRQCEMAVDVIHQVNARNVIMTYGTPSHVSNNGSQEEYKIAKEVKADIKGHQFLDINGVVFDIKHKIGSSGIPHGRTAALNKAILWNKIQAQNGTQPRAKILLRSHVHYHTFTGDTDCLAMTLPPLQGAGSKYGDEQCEGVVDFGMVWFNIEDCGEFSWDSHVVRDIVLPTVTVVK